MPLSTHTERFMWKPREFQELDSDAYALQRALESRQQNHEGEIIVQSLKMSSNMSNSL